MKSFILALLFSLLATAADVDFTGHWNYESESASFSLRLEQKGTSVSGNHSSVMLGGQRIDAAMDDDITIQGTVENGELVASVKSMYGVSTGTARISFVGQDSIYFEFIERPTDCWIPDKVVLTKLK